MKKLCTLLLTALTLATAYGQQQILLLTETFENGTNPLDFTTGGVGTNSGSNQWIVNNVYSGAPTYPDTPPQDSVANGNVVITNAPHSTYLHIYDNTSGINNANWNGNNASDRFTFIGNSFCTLAMTDVIFTFCWISEGDTNAYGEVYYRVDGGPWLKTGQAKYNNQSKWKYESIQDPAFENVQDLQFGFRWVNPASGAPSTVSFGIDDIIAVGTYDDVNNPVTISIHYLYPDTVCQDRYLTIGYTLSAPMCDGVYELQMSDANGSFFNPVNGGVFHVFPPDTIGYVGFQVPNNVIGNCFRMRINRLSPLPRMTGVGSACFSIIDCPESIFTNNAPVMNDPDTTCIQSVIDVKFNSIGVFGPGNIYTAQLSDASGSFANPSTLGTLPSDEAFPGPPGTVSGVIPVVPPGCGYYIRVVSSIPPVIGSRIGPFCLTQCDELTNNIVDIHVCLNGSTPYPEDENLTVTINRWNNNAAYDTCNDWRIELRSMMDFSFVNIDSLGTYHSNSAGTFVIDFPPFVQQLIAKGVQPGAYYMRVVSDCSNLTWNQTGSVIRLTIGAPDTSRPVIYMVDTVECNFGIVPIYVFPFHHPPSDYEWAASGINNGDAFIWPENPLLINFTNAPVDDYVFLVREINFGCVGAYSDPGVLSLITIPGVNITGDTLVCVGDTVTYDVTYLKETYYNWDAPAGVTILDEGNSRVTMIFDTVGTYTISNFSLNKCGGDSGNYTVRVISPYVVDAGPDTMLCGGEPITLTAQTDPVEKLFTTRTINTNQYKQGGMFNIIAHGDVVIDSFAVKYQATSLLITQEIYGKTGTYRSYEQNPAAWNLMGSYANFPSAGPNRFTVIPIPVNHPMADGDTFAFYVTTTNSPVAVNMQYSPGLGVAQEVVYKTDNIIDFVQGNVINYSFGLFTAPRVLNMQIYYTTKAGLNYLWNTGETSATINFNADQTAYHSVLVFDSMGCKNTDSMLLTVKPSPAVNAGPDTSLCDGEITQLHGSTPEQNFRWDPTTGLSDTAVLDPMFTSNQTTQYTLSSVGANGCTGRDVVIVTILPLPQLEAGPDTTVCNGFTYVIPATSSTPDIYWTPASGLDDDSILNPTFGGIQGYTYYLFGTDAFGCKNFDSVKIRVGTIPTVEAGLDQDICTGEKYTMTAVSSGQFFLWSPAEGLSDASVLNPIFSGPDSTKYYLVAKDDAGCEALDSVRINVISCYLKIPQAFTPNGDNINDHFTVFGGLTDYEIKIFNRWGEVVYHSQDLSELNDLNKGWDGTFKGKLQELGTFVYYVTGKDGGGKNIEKKGNITLIR